MWDECKCALQCGKRSKWVLPNSACIHRCCYSVTKSCDSLWPHGIYYARFPCPSLSPGVCSNSCPLMSSNHLILCLLSPPVFNLSQHQDLFRWVTSLHQMARIGSTPSVSFLPMNIQGWFPLGLTGLISLFQVTNKSLLYHHSSKASILWRSSFFMVQISHPYMVP